MAVDIADSLFNPNAEEWRPISQLHSLQPHHIFPHLQFLPCYQLSRVAWLPQRKPLLQLQAPLFCPQVLASGYAEHLASPDGKVEKLEKTISAFEEKGFPVENQHPWGSIGCSHDNGIMSNGVSATLKKPRIHWRAKYLSLEKKPPRPLPPNRKWKDKNSAEDKVAALPLRPSPCIELPKSSNTTVMIKNIPNQLSRDFMLEFLDQSCKIHSLEYDFLYLPMDFKRRQNLGYAFVNLTSPATAAKFSEILRGYKWSEACTHRGFINSVKICDISWAKFQGKEALIQRFKDCVFECDDRTFLPVVLEPPRNGTNTNPPPPLVIGKVRPSQPVKLCP